MVRSLRPALLVAALMLNAGCAIPLAMYQNHQRAKAQEEAEAKRQADAEAELARLKARHEELMAQVAAAKSSNDPEPIVEAIKSASSEFGRVQDGQNYRDPIHKSAIEALFAMKAWDTFFQKVHSPNNKYAAIAETHVGEAAVLGAAKEYFQATAFTELDAYWNVSYYLNQKKVVEAALCPTILKSVKVESLQRLALEDAVEAKCDVSADAISKFINSDDSRVRVAAVRMAMVKTMKTLKKKIETVRYQDPYYSDGCHCYPVRDAAARALIAFE